MINLSSPRWVPIFILLVATVAVVAVVAVTFFLPEYPSDPIIPTILQVLILIISIASTHLIAQQSVSVAAQDFIRERAKSALRRIRSISHSHLLLFSEINTGRQGRSAQELLRLVHFALTYEMKLLDDAVEDWRDILPEDLKSIEESGEGLQDVEDLKHP